jgi:hypothetical protein
MHDLVISWTKPTRVREQTINWCPKWHLKGPRCDDGWTSDSHDSVSQRIAMNGICKGCQGDRVVHDDTMLHWQAGGGDLNAEREPDQLPFCSRGVPALNHSDRDIVAIQVAGIGCLQRGQGLRLIVFNRNDASL